MKYILVNDTDTLANIDASDEVLLFPQTAVLGMETKTDTTASIWVQSSADIDDADELVLVHPDASAAATHKTFRNLVDNAVALINNDNRSGVGVMFDLLNNVKLENQTLASSTVTED
jgi:phage-related protein